MILKKLFPVLFFILTIFNTLNYVMHIREKQLNPVVDFHIYYDSTKDFFSNKISPYFAILPKVKSEGQYFIYPPTFLLFFAPVVLLPEDIAEKLWIILNVLIFFCASFWFAVKMLGFKKNTDKLLLILILYNFNPFFLCIFFGQIDIIILVFLYLSFYLIRKNRENIAGSIVGILTLIKLTPIIFSLYFLLRRNLNAVKWLVLTMSAIILLTLLIFPSGIYSDFGAALLTVNRNSDRYIMPLSKNIFSFYGRIFLDNRFFKAVIADSPVLFYISYAVSSAVLFLAIFLRRAKLDKFGIFSLVITASAIILPNALVYSLVFVLPAILIFYGKINTTRGLSLFCLIYFAITFHYSLYPFVKFGIFADFVPLLGNLLLFTSIAFNFS